MPYTSPVGSFAANGYGVYDLAGNIGEWCWDWYGASSYDSSPVVNPPGPLSGLARVIRGGNWGSFAYSCRVSCRDYDYYPDGLDYYVRFRCVLPPGQ